jgi:uncharacterized membrane protein YtjA (UPF0391 family)
MDRKVRRESPVANALRMEQARSASRCFRAAAQAAASKGSRPMLGWSLVFLVLALVAGYLGFAALAGVAATIAKVLFLVFLVLLVVSFVIRAIRGQSVV